MTLVYPPERVGDAVDRRPRIASTSLTTTMDSFMNLAKQGIQAYEKSQSDVSKTGGHEYNSPHHSEGGRSGYGRPDFDDDEVVNTASREGNGDSSLFTTALGFLKGNKEEHERPLDEEDVQRAHRKAYDEDAPSTLSATSLGSAAALQILKQFTSGSSEKTGGSGKLSSQTQLISLAMAEASKLFDKSGGAASGNKQDAVNGAAMTVMKLLVQSKFGGGTTGGANSGGLSGLLGMLSILTNDTSSEGEELQKDITPNILYFQICENM
ncbi:hypothetical protein C8Q76DRAFT_781620 [Earliella scabrosa]|nr:hypothetical protein C8Q76DRAFT_781620 [Earliella scabrosa]